MGPVRIDDPEDERVADYRDLTDRDLRRRREHDHGVFIAEGALAIRQLLRSTYRVRSVLVTPPRLAALAGDLAGLEAPVYVAEQAVMNRIGGFDIHRGALAAADRRPLPKGSDLLGRATRVAILEGINDHENLGAIFRNAAALGMDAILLCPRCCDPLYRRAVRVSVGHVLTVPYARLVPWPEALEDVRTAGFTSVALTPHPTAEPISEVDPGIGRVAVLLGAEGPGLTEGALRSAGRKVRIPVDPRVDSLNVASASAVAFHRLGRLR